MKRSEVRNLLLQAADSSYKEFNDRITNSDAAPSIGVRVPDIREIAKDVSRNGWEPYLKEMEELSAKAEESGLWQEEHMLWGIVIGLAKMDEDMRAAHLDRWVSGILSWADCDSSVSSFKFMKKNQNFWYSYDKKWMERGGEFQMRFALVSFMQYFINDTYIDQMLDIFSGKSSAFACGLERSKNENGESPYYIRMAQAWALSVCFVKYREKTWKLFAQQSMDPWVQNKAIQKCRESYRVTPEDKELLKQWKM